MELGVWGPASQLVGKMRGHGEDQTQMDICL